MTTFGGATTLISGTITLTIPQGTKYWYLQNQDTTILSVTFPAGSGFGPIALNPYSISGAVTGWAGDWLDSVGFPFFGASVTLIGTGSAQFGSGYSLLLPINAYEVKGTYA